VESTSDPDLQLVRACQDPGSDRFEVAFEELYGRYRDRVYSIAYRITGGAADAMDVVQEAFSLLFRKIADFRGQALFSTWLFRIVVNCSIDFVRQERARRRHAAAGTHRPDGTADGAGEPTDGGDLDPATCAASSELGTHVHASLQKLSPKLRAILVLRYLEGLSYEQLADALAISMGTVKSRLARAHLALEHVLRGTLAAYGYPEEGLGREGVA
jgi:RNA polymerase sigma-70 factor (ECF subfamily)